VFIVVGYTGHMPEAQSDTGPVTFVNAFELDPDEVDGFIDSWKERAAIMRRQPGFRSFHLHRALTPDASYQLVNVAVWDSVEALRAATANPDFQAGLREAAARFSAVAHPGVYTSVMEATAD
jgi:heme-degrading monooxygenase HmoA